MPLEQFKSYNFRPAALAVIDQANTIIGQYQAQGYVLTLRMLYYQFVSRGLLPNTMRDYKRLGDIISNGRLAGLIDWEAIEDHHRTMNHHSSWADPASFMPAVANAFQVDMWEHQPAYCEVWVEKDALLGVIERPCKDLRVPYFACKGYASSSQLWSAGHRMRGQVRRLADLKLARKAKGATPIIVFHLGDHDPSGIDMTRDNESRLDMFSAYRDGIRVVRLALNMDQVRKYNPPPNPAKMTDSRIGGYLANYGNQSWELDALDPAVIDRLIRDAVNPLINKRQWKEDAEREAGHRRNIELVGEYWNDVMSNM